MTRANNVGKNVGASREERLAAALRANLIRRKAQIRSRSGEDKDRDPPSDHTAESEE